MKIAIDASMVGEDKAGIGYYTNELLKELVKQDASYLLYTHNAKYLASFASQKSVQILEIPARRPNLWWFFRMSLSARKQKVDWLISPSNFILSALFSCTVQVVHDVSPITHPENVTTTMRIKFKILLGVATIFAQKLVCISEYTKSELIRLFPRAKGKSYYIGVGLNEWTKVPQANEQQIAHVLKKYQLQTPYFLSVSTLQPRKNYKRAIEAFAEFVETNPTWHYAIAGKKGWYFEQIFEAATRAEVGGRVHFLGYVPEKDIPMLFDGSSGLIFVSTEEGAGLPPLEALARKKHVVLSDIPVHRETAGEEAIYVDPLDATAIAEGMRKASKLQTQPDVSILKKHSWKSVASRLQKVIQP